MRFDIVSYDLNLAEDERCFYHHALQHTSRPMCFGVSDRALFIARERFLKVEAYEMQRIPFSDVKEVVLSRERGTWVWLKWAIVLAFGIASMIIMQIGLVLAPNVKPGLFGVAGPIAFAFVGLAMLIDNRWRLVLTIRTPGKDWRWRPSIFDRQDEVRALRESFLDACRYVGIRTRRLDLASESEIQAFWRWFENHAKSEQIVLSSVRARLHKLCDRIDVEIDEDGERRMTITANYARDAFPIVEELVSAAPQIQDLSVIAFKQRRKTKGAYSFEGMDYPLDRIFFVPYTHDFELAIDLYADLATIGHEVLWALCQDELGEYDFVFGIQYLQIIDLSDASGDLYLSQITELAECVDEFHCLDVH
jgi:hypothetical protein